MSLLFEIAVAAFRRPERTLYAIKIIGWILLYIYDLEKEKRLEKVGGYSYTRCYIKYELEKKLISFICFYLLFFSFYLTPPYFSYISISQITFEHGRCKLLITREVWRLSGPLKIVPSMWTPFFPFCVFKCYLFLMPLRLRIDDTLLVCHEEERIHFFIIAESKLQRTI